MWKVLINISIVDKCVSDSIKNGICLTYVFIVYQYFLSLYAANQCAIIHDHCLCAWETRRWYSWCLHLWIKSIICCGRPLFSGEKSTQPITNDCFLFCFVLFCFCIKHFDFIWKILLAIDNFDQHFFQSLLMNSRLLQWHGSHICWDMSANQRSCC